jgi:hypothetical protein
MTLLKMLSLVYQPFSFFFLFIDRNKNIVLLFADLCVKLCNIFYPADDAHPWSFAFTRAL